MVGYLIGSYLCIAVCVPSELCTCMSLPRLRGAWAKLKQMVGLDTASATWPTMEIVCR